MRDRGGLFFCITPENHSFNLKLDSFFVAFVLSGELWQLFSDEEQGIMYIIFNLVF